MTHSIQKLRKRCPKCTKHRHRKSFAKDNKRPDGLYPYCRKCQAGYAKRWRDANYERELAKQRARYGSPAAKRSKREWHLKRSYGIDLNEYHRMRRKQHGLCLICRSYFGTKLVVDHNHKTGRVRGLLCCGCNSDIRLFEQDKRVVRRILIYLT